MMATFGDLWHNLILGATETQRDRLTFHRGEGAVIDAVLLRLALDGELHLLPVGLRELAGVPHSVATELGGSAEQRTA